MIAGTISIFKEENSDNEYNLKDKEAIKKIIFNGNNIMPDKNGVAIINNYIDEIFKDNDFLAFVAKDSKKVENTENGTKKIIFETTEKEEQKKENTIFAINDGEKYSLITFKNNKFINLSDASFEDENLDFDYITNNKIYNTTFTTYKSFYNFLIDNNLSNKKDDIKSNDNNKFQSAFIYNSFKYPKRDKYVVYITYGNRDTTLDKIHCYKLTDYKSIGNETFKYEIGEEIFSNMDFFDPSTTNDEVYLTNMNILVRQLNDPRME